MRIGRDHIASVVNTLVLAYAGAALPLLLLFSIAQSSVGTVATSELVAEEIVRTLVGSHRTGRLGAGDHGAGRLVVSADHTPDARACRSGGAASGADGGADGAAGRGRADRLVRARTCACRRYAYRSSARMRSSSASRSPTGSQAAGSSPNGTSRSVRSRKATSGAAPARNRALSAPT